MNYNENFIHRNVSKVLIFSALFIPILFMGFSSVYTMGQDPGNFVIVEARPYPGRDAVMWDGVYAARSGKVYSGLMREGASSNFYEYDPVTDSNRLLFNMSEFLGMRGKGIRTPSKIHNAPVEDNDGNIYFVPMNNGSGPRNIDFLSWPGGYWLRYEPGTGKLENLGLVDKQVGFYPLTIDRTRNFLFGVAFNGYLYRFDIENGKTTKLDRVANWDINRNIFCDDKGNVYGSFPPGRVWKYEAEHERVVDLNIRQPHDPTFWPQQMRNPMLDRTDDWRAVDWDPINNVAYGITCGSGNILFRFDPHRGPHGEFTALTRLCDPKYWGTNQKNIPFAPLAFTLDSQNQKIYFVPSARSYQVGEWAETFGTDQVHHLIMYDIASGKRVDLGKMVTEDGRRVFGCEGATTGPDGTVYIVGQVEVENEENATRFVGGIPAALHLVIYKPE
jgi:hypothetical protein